MPPNLANGSQAELPYIDLEYNPRDSAATAKELVCQIQPEWRAHPEHIQIVQFKEGITNTAREAPKGGHDEIDHASILMRSYGNNTDILIDRDREATSHMVCAQHGLAPPLLARFRNGLLYRYIPGQACTAQDLIQEETWRPVARLLGRWHAILPISAISADKASNGSANGSLLANSVPDSKPKRIVDRSPSPNIWTVMLKWVHALPQNDAKQRTRKTFLEDELERSFRDLDNDKGPGNHGFVFGHGDLLSANVIKSTSGKGEVAVIDYEYAVSCSAAFDIANHFAEWGGYDCDYNMLPTRSIRRMFLQEYLISYNKHAQEPVPESMLSFLEAEVDRYRGMPGLYWGIWALIQATISTIDFNYAEYAEIRLDEYSAWRKTESDGQSIETLPKPLRERRWAED
ncbi:hypothetical protein DV737_g513, partial [Chaetothyriales sp. CBS 132003]